MNVTGNSYEELVGNMRICAKTGLRIAIAERKEA
jgi:hypothetical protein